MKKIIFSIIPLLLVSLVYSGVTPLTKWPDGSSSAPTSITIGATSGTGFSACSDGLTETLDCTNKRHCVGATSCSATSSVDGTSRLNGAVTVVGSSVTVNGAAKITGKVNIGGATATTGAALEVEGGMLVIDSVYGKTSYGGGVTPALIYTTPGAAGGGTSFPFTRYGNMVIAPRGDSQGALIFRNTAGYGNNTMRFDLGVDNAFGIGIDTPIARMQIVPHNANTYAYNFIVSSQATTTVELGVHKTGDIEINTCEYFTAINHSGATLATGTVVTSDEWSELAITTNPANGRMPVGIIQDLDGLCTNGATCRVGYAGTCWVQLEPGETCSPATEYVHASAEGRALCDNDTTQPQHNGELGHPTKITTAATTLIRIRAHFN